MGEDPKEELESLDRVLTRLAMVNDSSRLQAVLDKLLPRLLRRLNASQEILNKTMVILQHVNKRVKEDTDIKLPCFELVDMAKPSGDNSNFTINFALVYLELGAVRLTPGEKSRLLPKLFREISRLQENQQVIVLRVLAEVLPFVSISGDMNAWFEEETSDEDKAFVRSYFLDWLFYIPVSTSAVTAGVPPGLTPGRIARLKKKDGSFPGGAELANLQVSILKLLLSGAFKNEHIVPHLVVARNGLRHDVVSTAEQGMSRLLKSIDFGDLDLLISLIQLVTPTTKSRTNEEGSRKHPSPAVRERALGVLLKGDEHAMVAVIAQSVLMVEDCLIASQSTAELRILALQYVQFLLRVCSREALEMDDACSSLSLTLQKQLEQAKQYGGSNNTLREREQTFSCFGKFVRVFPELYKDKVTLVSDLMRVMQVESDVRMAIQEALGGLCAAFSSEYASDNARETIKKMLLPYLFSDEPKARLVVSDWCRRLFPYHDCQSRFVSLLLSCDNELPTRLVAVRGLVPELCNQEGKNVSASKWTQHIAELLTNAAKVECARVALAWTDKTSFPEEYSALNRTSKAKSFPTFHDWLAFINGKDGIGGKLLGSSDSTCQTQLACVLGFSNTVFLHADQGTVSKVDFQTYRTIIEQCMESNDTTKMRVLHRVASKCLLELVKADSESFEIKSDWLLGLLTADSPVVRENGSNLIEYMTLPDPAFVDILLERMSKRVPSAVAGRHGAILATGRLLHAGRTAIPLADRQRLSQRLVDTLMEASTFRIITIACIEAIGEAAMTRSFAVPEEVLEQVIEKLERISAYDGTPSGNPELDSSTSIAVSKALVTLGKICSQCDENPALKERTLKALFVSGDQKSVELQLDVSAAFSDLCETSPDMLEVVLKRILNEASVSTKNRVRAASAFWLLRLVCDFGSTQTVLPLLERIHATFASLLRERNELTRECAARGMAWAYQSAKSDKMIQGELVTSLARHLAVKSLFISDLKKEEEKKKKQREIDEANKASVETRVQQALNQGDAENEDDDKKADDPQSKTGGGSLAPLNTAYKEIYQISTKVGKPDLTYRLLYLSVADALWGLTCTRHLRCDTYEFDPEEEEEEGAKQGKKQRHKHDLSKDTVERLIPILFRYKYDIEPSIKVAMTKLWDTITVDLGAENEIIQERFDTVMKEVLKNISSNKFRERHSGAVALVFLIRESPDSRLISYLEEIWGISLRLVDDLHDGTKAAAAVLAKTLSNLTVRLCTKPDSEKGADVAVQALDTVLPFLVEKGLVNQSKDAQAISVHTLARVVKVSKENIRPSIPIVVTKLLESMSALEDKVLQYAMFHTSDQGGDMNVSRDQLESMRVQASSESPMQQAVDLCIDQIQPNDDLNELAPELSRLARSGVGLPTLAATSRVISRIAGRRELESGIRTHAQMLLKGVAGSLTDRSPMIRRSFSGAAASIARVAEPGSVTGYVKVLDHLYFDPGDEKSRMTVGTALRELLGRAPDLFKQLESQLLPLIFLARHDSDEDIAQVWQQVWSENAGTVKNGVNNRLDVMVRFCNKQAQSTVWLHRQQAAEALTDIVNAVDEEQFAPYAAEVMENLAASLPGRVWDGKEMVLHTICNVWRKCHAGFPDKFKRVDRFCLNVLVPECSRKAVPKYTLAAYESVVKVCLFEQNDQITLVTTLIECIEHLQKLESTTSLLTAKAFEALSSTWCVQVEMKTLDRALELSIDTLRGSTHIVATGVMRCIKRILALTDPVNTTQVNKAINVAWQCVIENKNPTTIISAIEALDAFFSRSSLLASADIEPLRVSSRVRLEPLLQHREHSIVHAASKLQKHLNNT
eukprot:CAMPEP_0203753948 /NCGR_PEP_ID=MMETSP0098-20131031/7629_1 /ASSEMBLY_ACC=CAM_ASM_000208 /TAXON_ID=96639 /ORGANISM=" , Strain NY0313808BC1" /LENGTH=1829 /DNA_ID=CAMNT_0050644769 /DNA_START=495 /DNA_END=5984 /DNA_ORIENTATION=-